MRGWRARLRRRRRQLRQLRPRRLVVVAAEAAERSEEGRKKGREEAAVDIAIILINRARKTTSSLTFIDKYKTNYIHSTTTVSTMLMA